MLELIVDLIFFVLLPETRMFTLTGPPPGAPPMMFRPMRGPMPRMLPPGPPPGRPAGLPPGPPPGLPPNVRMPPRMPLGPPGKSLLIYCMLKVVFIFHQLLYVMAAIEKLTLFVDYKTFDFCSLFLSCIQTQCYLIVIYFNCRPSSSQNAPSTRSTSRNASTSTGSTWYPTTTKP